MAAAGRSWKDILYEETKHWYCQGRSKQYHSRPRQELMLQEKTECAKEPVPDAEGIKLIVDTSDLFDGNVGKGLLE